jgi:hypothetical protein
MLIIVLLVIIALLAVAVFQLFHGKMVDLSKWHAATHADLQTVKQDYAALKAYVETHLHLHTAPPTSALAANAGAAKS